MGRLDGKIAIVTGASRGIGRAIAKELALEGAKVALNFQFNEAMALELAAEIQAAGGECMLDKANVADPNEARSMVAKVVEKWGRLDIIVNNAGITRDSSRRWYRSRPRSDSSVSRPANPYRSSCAAH